MRVLLRPTVHIISKSQFRFFKGRLISDNINTLINITQNKKSRGSLCFLDQEKAYDKVDHRYLSKCLNFFNIEKSFITWISRYQSKASFRVIGNNFKTEEIQSKRGLKQGDPMSPILYNLTIDPLLRKLNENIIGIKGYGQEDLKTLAFADDCVIGIGSNEDSRLTE